MRRLMTLPRRSLRRASLFLERLRHALDLKQRLGFPWADAWRIAGTWQ